MMRWCELGFIGDRGYGIPQFGYSRATNPLSRIPDRCGSIEFWHPQARALYIGARHLVQPCATYRLAVMVVEGQLVGGVYGRKGSRSSDQYEGVRDAAAVVGLSCPRIPEFSRSELPPGLGIFGGQ